jgi:hypothetical protein
MTHPQKDQATRSGRHRARPSRPGTPLRRRLTAAGVASLLLTVLIPLVAKGDTPPAGSNGSVGRILQRTWIGFYQIPGIDGPVVCGHNGDGSWYPDTPYSAGTVVASSGDGAAVAWLLQQYADTTDPNSAAAIDAVNSRYGSNTGGLDDYNIAEANQLGGLVDSMLATGRHNAGPYTVTITGLVTAGTGHFDTTYSATVHLRSADGAGEPNQLVTLTGHNAHLVTPTVRTNALGDATFQYSVPASASPNFSIDAAASYPVLTRYAYLGGQGPNLPQDVVGYTTRAVTGAGAGAVDPYLSAITFIKYTTGDPAKKPVAGAVFAVTDLTQNRALGSITSQATPVSLAGADINAGDTLRFVETKAPPGHYSSGTTIITIPANAPDNYQVQIANPTIPTLRLTTQVNTAIASTSTVLTDTVTIAGNDGEDGTGTGYLLGPIQPGDTATDCTSITDEQWANAPLAGTFTYQIDGSVTSGNGTHFISATSTNHGPGCYGWQQHVVLTPSGATGDSTPTDPGETTLVLAPQVTTAINTPEGTVGSYLSDTLTVTGTHGRQVQVTGQLMQTAPDYIGRQPTCLSRPGQWDHPSLFATVQPFTVTGDGTTPVPGRYLTTSLACYSFTYQLKVILTATSSTTVTLPAGDPTETALASVPTITTTVSADTVNPASAVADAIKLTNLHLAAGDTATLRSWYLGNETTLPAGPAGASNPCLPQAIRDQLPPDGQPAAAGCTPTGWDTTAIAATPPTITVTGDGTYDTDPIITPTQPGYGTFVQTLTYNGVTVLITPPAEPGEVVHVAAPDIATIASNTPVDDAGTASVSDTLTVTGLHLQPGDHATVTAQILTAPPGPDGCASIDWDNADHDGTPTTLDVAADGQYTTAAVSVPAGCHSFFETLAINGQHVTTGAEQPGQPTETLLLTPAPPVTPTPTPTPTSSSPSPSTSPTPTPSKSSTPASTVPAPTTTPPTHQPPASTPAAPNTQRPDPKAAGGGSHRLAYTGTPIAAELLLAVLVLGAGAVLLTVSRRRTRRPTH